MQKAPEFPSTFEGLVALIGRLRGPDGCPWDREQTPNSMKRQLIEECYELIEAVESGESEHVSEETGDVLGHMAFQVNFGVESGEFTAEAVLGSIIEKLVRRHPHVFGDTKVDDARGVESQWEAIKQGERGDQGSVLEGVTRSQPALALAQTLQERASRVGFDWDSPEGVREKVREELVELAEASSQSEREAELGDLMFSLVNLGRWLDVDAEGALRAASRRFQTRFAHMEGLCRDRGLGFDQLTLAEKEGLWVEAKAAEASG